MNKIKLKKILKDKQSTFNVKRDESETIVDKHFIKKLRIKFDFTQVVFASILGVSVKTIEKWEQGVNEPRPMAKKLLYLVDKKPELIDYLYSPDPYGSMINSKSFIINYTEGSFRTEKNTYNLFNKYSPKSSILRSNQVYNECVNNTGDDCYPVS